MFVVDYNLGQYACSGEKYTWEYSDLFISGVSPLTILKTKKKVGAKEGDFVTLINIFLKYKNSKQN